MSTVRCVCGIPGDGGPGYNQDPLIDCPRHGPGGPDTQYGPRCPFVATTGQGENQEPDWYCVLPEGHPGQCAPTEAEAGRWWEQPVADAGLDEAERAEGAYTAKEPRR